MANIGAQIQILGPGQVDQPDIAINLGESVQWYCGHSTYASFNEHTIQFEGGRAWAVNYYYEAGKYMQLGFPKRHKYKYWVDGRGPFSVTVR